MRHLFTVGLLAFALVGFARAEDVGQIKTAKGATLECAGDEPGSPSGAFLD